jgi:quinol monooxygenase YgiN
MITVVVTIKPKPGREKEFEKTFHDYAGTVRANEPGTILYTLNRSRDDAAVYQAIEIYADDAAMRTHLRNFEAAGVGDETLFVSPPAFKVLDRLV